MGRNPSTPATPAMRPAWLAVLLALAYTVVIAAAATRLVTFPWPWVPGLSAAGLALTVVVTVMQSNHGGNVDGWGRVYGYRATVWVVLGGWATYVGVYGLGNPRRTLILAGLLVLLTLGLGRIGNECPCPAPAPQREADLEKDDRPDRWKWWEARLRRATKWKDITVTDVKPWDVAKDGETLTVDLPDDGKTAADLRALCLAIAHAARLPTGCAVEVRDTQTQGIVLVDVNLRYTFDMPQPVYVEPTTEASILDPFPIMTTARGLVLTVCLRIFSMVIGGTTGSGKSTLLHRIIMYLARCSDTLIWVGDVAGGGVAEPHNRAWWNGETDAPVIDWLADNEAELALMGTVLVAIIEDRRSDPWIIEQMERRNSFLLKPAKGRPAILLLTDEGGAVRKNMSLLAQRAVTNITSATELGRAMAIRVVLSVLRGTADALDKAYRVHAAIRVCLRVDEGEEFHILETTPKARLRDDAEGAGWLRPGPNTPPVIGRTLNVDRAAIRRHSIAVAHLRPVLDDRARHVASLVTAADVCGKTPPPDLAGLPQLVDADAGMAYENRWKRWADRQAVRAGGRQNPRAVAAQASAAPARVPPQEDALGDLIAGVDSLYAAAPPPVAPSARQPRGNVIPFPNRGPAIHRPPVTAPRPPARQRLLAILAKDGPLGANELERRVGGTRSNAFELMKKLIGQGLIVKTDAGYDITEAGRGQIQRADSPTA